MLPALPENEAERLADLHALGILDTPPEERYDRILDLAEYIFRVPISYIALIDASRQWFKAQCGLLTNQTSREESFCAHTIHRNEPLVVPDATLDKRFTDNPLVVGPPHIRFYAGIPLTGPCGMNVGTLALADHEPRELSDEQLRMFQELAEIAQKELHMTELIHLQHDVLETKKKLAQTQKQLSRELTEASEYICSLIPEPIQTGPFRTNWRYIPSSRLGGDFLGYHTLKDPNITVFYILDVSGHGVGASLLACSVHNVLRSESLPDTDFGDPAAVLAALDRAFPMDDNNFKFFTIWYGVYDQRTRRLKYSGGGHHPSLLYDVETRELQELFSAAPMIGAGFGQTHTNSTELAPGSRLYLFSDGVFEVSRKNSKAETNKDDLGELFSYEQFRDVIHKYAGPKLDTAPDNVLSKNGESASDARLGAILTHMRNYRGGPEIEKAFDDDFSLLEIEFS